ncbi:Odorant receptor 294 [Nylanderia fulva]|uniref:Odorant receptor n=1 Tax=Nylanderia fulva TaxID=613905 RepID=A0A6G1LR85_9HYME|nr:odorant receptor 49b-like [Nylanderia fulva]KAF3054647.1 Odorant receptor 294 [Nylanderia fulva]
MTKLTPQKAIRYMKLLTAINCTVPLQNSTRFQLMRFKVQRCIVWIHAVVTLVAMMFAFFYNIHNFSLPRLIQICSVATAILQIPWQILCFTQQYNRLQYLILEMEDHFIRAEGQEREIYQHYIDKNKVLYAISTGSVHVSAVLFWVQPFVNSEEQPFPLDALYPFNVYYQPMHTIIFLSQCIAIYQVAATVCHNCLFGLLVWFTIARFEILSNNFRNATNIRDIITCILEHLKLIRYTQDVIASMSTAILIVMIICSLSIIVGGLVIIGDAEIADKINFAVMFIAGLFQVYMYVLPSDHLISATTNIANAVYNSDWFNQELAFQSNVLYVLFRSQTPLTIQVSSMIPALSLNYFSSYVSSAFSYLMSLRVLFLE